MKNLFLITTLLFSFNLFAKCGDQKLEITDIQKLFKNGSLTSEYFADLKLKKRVRRCNHFSGCEEWSSARATLALGEIVSSYDTELNYHFYPQDAEAYFTVSPVGKLELLLEFFSLDISARVHYDVTSSKIALKSNSYFRPSGAHVQPTAYASYLGEEERFPFNLEGHIGKNCIELKSKFTQNLLGIIYDEFEVSLNGTF